MRGANFTQCRIDNLDKLRDNDTFRSIYGYDGPVQHIPKNVTSQITTRACKELCGTGVQYYPWNQVSTTISTWVLPISGVLVQAPFVSNAFWETVFTTSRWVGSPMASLAYILWNIRVTGRAALMVDMAVPIDSRDEDPNSHFGSIRDSLYILTAMNQYSLNEEIRSKKEAAGLLRIALFSKNLRILKKSAGTANSLVSADGVDESREVSRTESYSVMLQLDDRCERPGHLNDIRQKLALQFRRNRRRGVVPVFISIMWFFFSLGIAIQDSFGYLGKNDTAHDLALGCLLCWLPVLVLCSIVDRNHVSSEDLQAQLNKLVNRVRESLNDPVVRNHFIDSITNHGERLRMQNWIKKISEADLHQKQFFKRFAGQGRQRWHYGVAHSILTDIESAYVKEHGRDWLRNEDEARHHLVLGKVSEGLDWFDYRELWQVAISIIIVLGTISGAFIISFVQPTVGLGCRSGGYTVFAAAAFGLLLLEMVTWWILDAEKRRLKVLTESVTRRASSVVGPHNPSFSWLHRLLDRFWFDDKGRLPFSRTADGQARLAQRHHRIQKFWSICVFRPLEFSNMVYMLYLVMAQTLGADETCDCMTSNWAKGGGYMDFNQYNVTNSGYVQGYWITGISITTSIAGLSMIYIVLEWCLQSHLGTLNMKNAASGLQNTRRFRRFVRLITWRGTAYSTPPTPKRRTRNEYLSDEQAIFQMRVLPPAQDDHPASNFVSSLPPTFRMETSQSGEHLLRRSRTRSSRSRSPGSLSRVESRDFSDPTSSVGAGESSRGSSGRSLTPGRSPSRRGRERHVR